MGKVPFFLKKKKKKIKIKKALNENNDIFNVYIILYHKNNYLFFYILGIDI